MTLDLLIPVFTVEKSAEKKSAKEEKIKGIVRVCCLM